VLGAATVARDATLPGENRVRRMLGMEGPNGTVPAAGPVSVTTWRRVLPEATGFLATAP
jgi:hypothetical protein